MKKIILLSIFCVFTLSIFAQQDAFSWRVGAYGGYNFYRGDLNSDLKLFQASQPLNNLPNTDWQGLLSYGGSLEYSSQGFGLKLLGTRGIFQANDRAVNRQGEFIEQPNFDRSLNAETQLYDVSLLATFYSDNGRFLSRSAFVSPYISVGFGGTYFNIFSNLSDANSRQYYYWSDGLIYDKPEDSQPTDAIQLTQDNSFETEVTNAKNEGVNYDNLVWNVPVAVGLKFRISERLNVNLEMMARYVNSDYLDDVSQRGSSDNKDIYGLASVSLHYNFGQKLQGFVPPVFYSLGAETLDKSGNKSGSDNSKPKIEAVETVIDTAKKVSFTKMETIPVAENPKRKSNIEPSKEVVLSESKSESANANANLKNEPVETVIDTVKKVVVIEELKVETPTALTNDKIFTAEKQTYLEVQKTRLEVAVLNEKANELLANYDASKIDSFMILNQKIEILNQRLQTYQRDMNNLAIQLGTAYTEPENKALEIQISALEAETEALRQKYRIMVLGENDPEAISKALAKIEAEKEAEKAKNEALDAEVKALEREYLKADLTIKLEQSNTTPTVKSEPVEPINNIENINIINATIDTSNIEKIDSAAAVNVAIPILSDSEVLAVNTYDAKLKALKNEVARLQMTVIPQKNQTIDSLKTKVNYLEGELKGTQETNKYWVDFFQKQIASLQADIIELNQNQTVAASALKPTVVEKIIAIPTITTTKTLQDLVNEFGISNVYFDSGKTNVKAEFHNRLNRVASMMNQNPEIVVVLKGYTDKSGNPELNFKLSKKRAEAVKTYLMNQGISTTKIDISYFGENKSAAVNDPFSRKVEVILVVQ